MKMAGWLRLSGLPIRPLMILTNHRSGFNLALKLLKIPSFALLNTVISASRPARERANEAAASTLGSIEPFAKMTFFDKAFSIT